MPDITIQREIMRESEKRVVAVMQYDRAGIFLRIDLDSANAKIVSKEDIDRSQVVFGLFDIEPDGNFVALLATPDGPLLCFKGSQYQAELDKTIFEVADQGKSSRFRVLHEGKEVFSMCYEEKFGIGLHPYVNTREDIDFYYWLSHYFNSAELYRHYAREILYLD